MFKFDDQSRFLCWVYSSTLYTQAVVFSAESTTLPATGIPFFIGDLGTLGDLGIQVLSGPTMYVYRIQHIFTSSHKLRMEASWKSYLHTASNNSMPTAVVHDNRCRGRFPSFFFSFFTSNQRSQHSTVYLLQPMDTQEDPSLPPLLRYVAFDF